MTNRAPMHWTSKSPNINEFTKLKNKLKSFSELFFQEITVTTAKQCRKFRLTTFHGHFVENRHLCLKTHTIKMTRQPENANLRKVPTVHLVFPKPCVTWCRSSPSGSVLAESCSWPTTRLNSSKCYFKPQKRRGLNPTQTLEELNANRLHLSFSVFYGVPELLLSLTQVTRVIYKLFHKQ